MARPVASGGLLRWLGCLLCAAAIMWASTAAEGPLNTPPPPLAHTPGMEMLQDLLRAVFGIQTVAEELEPQPLKVIGAGLGRTGTSSLKLALTHLGYKTYHMSDAMEHTDFRDWDRLFEHGDASAIISTLAKRGYNATTDFPACLAHKEFLEAYPEAKVILSVRDTPEQWCRSVFNTIYKGGSLSRRLPFSVLPPFKGLKLIVENLWDRSMGFKGAHANMSLPQCVAGYNHWIAKVKAEAPADRLLVFNVKEGWAPICAFLQIGAAACPATPFPRSNSGAELGAFFDAFVFVADYFLLLAAVAALLLALLLALVWRCCFGCCRRGGRPESREKAD